MIEAAMIWNEPNNKSHWDPEIDPDWSRFAAMAIAAGKAIRAERPDLPRVLGGIERHGRRVARGSSGEDGRFAHCNVAR